MKKTVAIFGQQVDPHVIKVKEELQKLGLKVQIYNIFLKEDFYCSDDLELSTIGQIKGDQFRFIWWRLKGLFRSLYAPDDKILEFSNNQKKEFWYSQWMSLLEGLSFDNTLQINPLIYQNPNKLLHLKIAKNTGLLIPKTVVSNDVTFVLKDIRSDNILLKPLNGTAYQTGKMIFAHKFDRNELQNQKEAISFCPSIFQNYVEKKYEVRSFVFGDNVISVKIKSQENPSSQTDWRANTYDKKMFEPYDLSKNEKNLLIKFLKTANLLQGVFDLIRHPSGELYFLECNPEGQWLFMEQATGQKMTQKFSEFLFEYSIQ